MFFKNFQRKSLKINMNFSLIEKTILKLSGRSVRIKPFIGHIFFRPVNKKISKNVSESNIISKTLLHVIFIC